MPDSKSTQAERAGQRWFTLRTLAGCVLLLLALNEINWRLIRPFSRTDLGPRTALLQLEPVRLPVDPAAPFTLAGAWEVTSDDRRLGGLSALVVDRGGLVAVSDSGGVVRLGRPRSGPVPAIIGEVPGGPRTPWLKANRDIEALLADPQGRGWWAAFEYAGELWLYNRPLDRSLERIKVGAFGRSGNAGIEGLAADFGDLLLFAETGGSLVRISGRTARVERVAGVTARISDVARLGPGRLLAIERQPSLLGFRNRLVEIVGGAGGYRRGREWPVPARWRDNFEGLAIERRAGRTRLWLVTDDNFQKPLRTLLIALDLKTAPTDAADAAGPTP